MTAANLWDADAYDQNADAQWRWGLEVAARVPPQAETILDLGCGSGRVTESLLERSPNARVTALDVSADMVDAARRRLAPYASRVTFAVGDAADPFPVEQPVDCVFSTGTLHWVRDHAACFANVFEALNPGGCLVSQCGGAGSLQRVRDRLEGLGVHWASHNRYADAEETHQVLADHGFIDVWCWLEARPTPFASPERLRSYLEATALAPYLHGMDTGRRQTVLDSVIDDLDELRLDFVRLNMLARRPA